MLVIPGRVPRFTSTTATRRPPDSTRTRHTDTVLIARQLFSVPIVWAPVIDFFGYPNVHELAAPLLMECLMLGWEVGTQ